MKSHRTWASIVKGASRRLGHAVSEAPGVLHLRRLAHEAEFAQLRPMNGCRGVYRSHAEALAAVPDRTLVGYDHPVMASMYRECLDALNPDDYPVLFWMRSALQGARRVFDIGGHVGIAWYTYGRYLPFPADFLWTVQDVPAVVNAGEALAKERGETRLSFTSRVEDMDGADILLIAGALQYMDIGFLPAALGNLQSKPRHVFVQRTPCHPERSFVTLQATGFAFCPYTITHRQGLIDDLGRLGYELVDSWTSARTLEIPFHEDCSIKHYSGMYFRLR